MGRRAIGIVVVCVLVSLTLTLLAGCTRSKKRQLKLEPVSGTIMLAGKPGPGVTVTFVPKGNTPGYGGASVTDENGRYELKTFENEAGVPAGEYDVTCEKLVMPDGSDFSRKKGVGPIDAGAREILPPMYSDLGRTTLNATVAPGGSKIDFDLKVSPTKGR